MEITINDYQRLSGLLQNNKPVMADRLVKALEQARMLPQENIPPNIVTMNSRVLLKELSGRRASEVTIAYPHEADSRAQRISVLSPIGAALLGRREGDIVSWQTPVGMSRFKVEKVTYQPEAAGHYHL